VTSVAHLLHAKGHAVWPIPPDAAVCEAIKLMADKEVGALLVMDGQRLVGIVSERDYARKVILQGKSSRDTPVREIMTD
jgi:CBS domain-containing protein